VGRKKTEKRELDYSLSAASPEATIPAPELPYQPQEPKTYRPPIGLIACGGITETHLKAYTKAGYNIVALCDLIEERARKRQKQFYPDALVTTDYRDVLARDDIEVVDIATHPRERVPLIEAALKAGKHVLSQKPFVLDLTIGERLVELADKVDRKLAVNQNGRWAPHFNYLWLAVHAGLIGDVLTVHQDLHWDHTWTRGTPFEEIEELVFYDFGIHWFDFVSHLLGDRKRHRVVGSKTRALGQTVRPSMLAQALIEFEGGQASLVFDACLPYGKRDTTYIGGTKGSLISEGPHLAEQTITLYTEKGIATPTLEGNWFPDGFRGTMGELLCAIETNREPRNSARENLRSLELCFAAIASARENEPKAPGTVRQLPPGSAPGIE
jgi:predicted dehydrogenase